MTEALKCPNCGGNIDRSRMICPYCGTQFKRDEPDVLHIATYQPGTGVLESHIVLDEYFIEEVGRETASELIVRELTRKIADALVPYTEVEISHDPASLKAHAYGRVRVIKPGYRF